MQYSDVVFMGQPPLRIDFLRSIDGVAPAELFSRAVIAEIDGKRIKVISLDDLIANKRAAGRLQDLLDAESRTRSCSSFVVVSLARRHFFLRFDRRGALDDDALDALGEGRGRLEVLSDATSMVAAQSHQSR